MIDEQLYGAGSQIGFQSQALYSKLTICSSYLLTHIPIIFIQIQFLERLILPLNSASTLLQ